MVVTPLEYMMAGMWILQTISSLVSSMNKPKRNDGAYLFFYKFSHSMTNNLDAWFEHKFDVNMPRVVDETATQSVATTSTEIQSPLK